MYILCYSKALRAVRRARFWDHVVLWSFVFHCLTILELCIIFDTLLLPWNVFWSHFCHFIVILGALWQPFLNQELDWSAKAATGGAKGQNANIKSRFWTPFSRHFWHMFKTCAIFSMSFRGDVLVMLSWCICVPFLTIFHPFRVPCDLCPKWFGLHRHGPNTCSDFWALREATKRRSREV